MHAPRKNIFLIHERKTDEKSGFGNRGRDHGRGRRSGGLGALILEKLRETEPDTVIFGEVEAPEDAPDPEMARRRLAFYARCGLKTAGYDTEMFGVHYKTLYLPGDEVEDAELMRQHRYVYESSFTPENFRKYVQIPWRGVHSPKVAWDE